MAEQEIKPQGAEMEVTDAVSTALEGAATAEDIRRIIAEEAEKQGIVVPGRDAKGRFAAQEPAEEKPEVKAEPDEVTVYTDSFVIGGKTYNFEGDSPADINRQVKAAIAAHEHATAPKVEAKPEVKSDDLVAMQLDVFAGKISMEDYLVKSGAIDKYLKSKGLQVDELKTLVDEKKSTKEVNAWQNATNEFLSLDGNDWPGGEQNLKVLGYKLAELGLKDSPSTDSLQKAYAAMKADKLVFAVEAPEAAPQKKKLQASGTFGVGSGNQGRKPTTATAAVPKITDDMSPREIMEAYKAAAQAQGMHPDDYLKNR
jgi:hypothetical protein